MTYEALSHLAARPLIVLVSIVENLRGILNDVVQNLRSAWLLFGSPADIALMALDILVTSLAVYFLLRLMADTRAWQLFKGILFILIFSFISDLIGLQTINFILLNSISVLAIGFVVIFQPELRRALETVGRNSLRMFSTVAPELNEEARSVHNIIESIVIACEHMALTYTGALIIIERRTRLGELIQGTAVVIDSALTSTLLEQIFYKGSPLHDGAVLVRGDRVYAARCHVPLSDNYHLRRDYGTRHRAAVGASEIGDTIAVVVSEERGSISIAMNGRLYPMRDGDAMRSVLHRVLARDEGERSRAAGLRGVLSSVVRSEPSTTVDGEPLPQTKMQGPARKGQLLLRLSSIGIALVLWFVVQMRTNPITEITVNDVPIQIQHEELVRAELGAEHTRRDNVVIVRVRVRQKYASRITRDKLRAEIDFAELDRERIAEDLNAGRSSTQKLPVSVVVDDLSSYAYQIVSRVPSTPIVVFFTPEPNAAPVPDAVPGSSPQR